MKKLIATAALALLLAACTQTNATPPGGDMMQGGMMQNGMMQQGDMMKKCPMMQNMESMQKHMRKNCQKMAKDCVGMTGDMARQCKDINKTCDSMMKDMDKMADMHKKMMQQCPMMKGSSAQPADDQSAAPADVSAGEHAGHHPQQ